MNATTRAGLHVAITDDGAVVVDGDQNTVTALGPIAAAVFQLADGTRDQAELLRAVGAQTGEQVEVEVIWSTLDRLADAGLLVERVTPPAGAAFIDRRSALRKAAAGTAAVG
ncbi:MAG: PqqD family protein, partial [Actinobacteria bacterium]|nr:PqqD family protein [Actinomycetota bacterium]